MKVLTVVGARPQFIKAAPVSRALAAAGIAEILVHTGQHFDPEMSDVFFTELGIPAPAINLGIHGERHGAMVGRMLEGLEAAMLEQHPDWVVVYGDTNSTLAGALAAAKLDVPVAHVEAGMRSYDRRMPEETNRVLADHVSRLLLCATETAVANLTKEGIVAGVHHVGDVMYDAALFAAEAARSSTVLDRLLLTDGSYDLATLHRAENTDDPERLAALMAWLEEQSRTRPVVMPLHPRTAAVLKRHGIEARGLMLCSPLSYLDLTRLLAGAVSVFTDSGGLQKEAYFQRKPCVTLREETEWVETIQCGWNRLWRGGPYAPRREIADYGDGHAAEKIAALLIREADQDARRRNT
ncbi:MAG TPA: UDP-N-acetylglucosamine 2-epimerase (non-hydrolyzing) [Stellaceae bacterium]|nr:UDP-N-acetylglucosamine 2-epimerase (non-hydrolyzing) [Stellaceae bacterium]